MGVQGLWSILEPTGKIISVETLENQILAIDISLWLHQSVKGFRNPGADGVAHVLGLFHRLCKLLFYGIRPVFVFDGRNIPQLKKDTLLKRRLRTRSSKEKVAESLRTKALLGHIMTQVNQSSQLPSNTTLAMQKVLKHGRKGLSSLLSQRTGNTSSSSGVPDKDLFELPPLPSASGDDPDIDEEIINLKFNKGGSSLIVEDIHEVEVEGPSFQALPKDTQYNVLFEMKEKRKMNSWAKIDSMPKGASSFSDFQVRRLLKRANIQKTMEKVEKELQDQEMEMIDPNLFVGDKKGLKAMRLASDNKRSVLYGSRRSKLQESTDSKLIPKTPQEPNIETPPSEYSPCQTEEALLQLMQESEEGSSSGIKTEDEDILTQEALLQSIHSSNQGSSSYLNPEILDSQAALLAMIKEENKDLVIEEIIDEDLVIFAPSLVMQGSNQRQGGKTLLTIKEEDNPLPGSSSGTSLPIDKRVKVIVSSSQDEGNKSHKDNDENPEVGVISSSEDENGSDQKEKQDGKNNEVGLMSSSSSSDENERDPNPTDSTDLFADVFKDKKNIDNLSNIMMKGHKSSLPTLLRKRPRRDSVSSDSSADEVLPHSSKSHSTDEDKHEPVKDIEEISNTMKNSEHLWLKIASKHVPVESSGQKKKDEKSTREVYKPEEHPLMTEGEMLVKEMNNSEKESRLLQYQNVDYSPPNTSVPQKEPDIEAEKEEVFGSSVPGFIRSGKSTNVVEVSQELSAESLFQETANSFMRDENSLDVRDLMALQNKLAAERETIIAEASRQERLAASVTDQMYQECQELLQIFGIPYVIAPGEAEAQCAYLENIQLTNGTVTDDSDVWVFGSRKVYKNFFEREKFVEFFSLSEIERKLGLNQGKMISIAMLTGSDYTEGIYNVGPITALEILAEFPGEELKPLNEFKNWLHKNQGDIDRPMSRVRENFKRLSLIEGFPSPAVLKAYKSPLVDESQERFTWAVPNFVAIRDYACEKFGFTYAKVDEMLGPIVKRIRAKSLQTRIDNYFVNNSLISQGQKEMTSKRGLSAIERVKGSPSKKSQDSPKKPTSKTNIGRKAKATNQAPKKLLSKEEKNEQAKRKALEVMKRESRNNKKGAKRPKRRTLAQHNLSEDSESD